VLAANTAANLSLVKDGGNTQTLSGINTYGGTTTVSNGTLLINGAITGTGAVTVGATGTLGGTGAIAGAVNVSGTLAPGASIGVLTSGGLTFADNSKFQYQVNSSVPHATGADLQIVNGVLNFGNSVALQLSDLGTGSFGGGTVFSLVNYSGAWNNGLLTFGDTPLDDDSIFNAFGKNWTIDYNATVKGDNVAAAAAGHYVNITLAGLSAYKTWITNPTFGITDPAKQDALADPDNDGITNVTEFAFDTLPNSGASGPATLEYTPFMIHGQPVLAQFSGVTNAVFDRRATYLSDGLTYTVQFSADLVNWETSGVTPTAIDASDSTIEVVRVPYPATILGGTQTPKFFRVLVTLAE
jgi:autotransporter-associated beta strand protein